MKKARFWIALFGCLIIWTSCKKDSLQSLKSQLIGSWELRNIQGGFWGPGGPPDVTPGNGNILKFSDSVYQSYSRGQLTGTGPYSLTKKDTYGGTYPKDVLIFNSNPDSESRFSIAKDTLTIYMGTIAADGFIAKYIRQ